MHTAIPTVRQLVASMSAMTLDELHALLSSMRVGKSTLSPRQYAALCVLIAEKTPARAGKGAK